MLRLSELLAMAGSIWLQADDSWLARLQIVAKVYKINPHPHHEIFLTLLSVLFCLHLYWCALVCPPLASSILYGCMLS